VDLFITPTPNFTNIYQPVRSQHENSFRFVLLYPFRDSVRLFLADAFTGTLPVAD
jgi:hypothetical protein